MASLRPAITLAPSECECLWPGGLITGRVITAYLRLIERRNLCYPELPRTLCFDTEFLWSWNRGGYPATSRRVDGIPLLKTDLMLFPLHLPGVQPHGHWALVAVEMASRQIRAFDPAHFGRAKEMRQVESFLTEWATQEGLEAFTKGWTLHETPAGCPRQTEATSCGVFVCVFADRIARRSELKGSRIDILYARKAIAAILRRAKFEEEDFSLLEPVVDSMKGRWGLDAARRTPLALIDICTPDGSPGRASVPDDALLEELTAAMTVLGGPSPPVKFGRLKKTPPPATHGDACPEPVEVEAAVEAGEEDWVLVDPEVEMRLLEADTEGASAVPDPEPLGCWSSCLSLDFSDLEDGEDGVPHLPIRRKDSTTDQAMAPKEIPVATVEVEMETETSPPGPAPTAAEGARENRHGGDQIRPRPRPEGARRKRRSRTVQGGRSRSFPRGPVPDISRERRGWHPQIRQDQPEFIVPKSLVAHLETLQRHQTPQQWRNGRWRLRRTDGTTHRLHASQILRLGRQL